VKIGSFELAASQGDTGATGDVKVTIRPERVRLEELAGPARRRLFFELWTEKEAYRKATGEGITAGLGELDWTGWTRLRPQVPDGYAAAIAVRAPDAVLRLAPWPP